MIRAWGFSVILVTALVVAACGRQVTPNPPGVGLGGALPGQMTVVFDVAAPFNFSNYQYWVIFNTSGDEVTPSTLPIQNNWDGYSGGIEVAGVGVISSVSAYQFARKASQPHQWPAFINVHPTPQQIQYTVNSNGTGTEFTVIFSRLIFNSILPSSPAPSTNWTYNAFTTQANVYGQLVFVDSMGAGGRIDPQYISPVLDTHQCFDQTFTARSLGLQIDPPAQIESVEIANNPSPAPSVSPCSGGSSPSIVSRP